MDPLSGSTRLPLTSRNMVTQSIYIGYFYKKYFTISNLAPAQTVLINSRTSKNQIVSPQNSTLTLRIALISIGTSEHVRSSRGQEERNIKGYKYNSYNSRHIILIINFYSSKCISNINRYCTGLSSLILPKRLVRLNIITIN